MVAHGNWEAAVCNYTTASRKCIGGWISGIIAFSFSQRMWHAGHYKWRPVTGRRTWQALQRRGLDCRTCPAAIYVWAVHL